MNMGANRLRHFAFYIVGFGHILDFEHITRGFRGVEGLRSNSEMRASST